MSEERFQRIETRLDTIVTDVSDLKAGQAALVADVSQLKIGQAALVEDVAQLKIGQAALVEDVAQLNAGQVALLEDVSQLKAGQVRTEGRLDKVEILQEEMRDNIKQIAESHAATQILLEQGFQGLHEALDRRLVPLEIAMRNRG